MKESLYRAKKKNHLGSKCRDVRPAFGMLGLVKYVAQNSEINRLKGGK